MWLRQLTAAADLPVDPEEVKSNLRIDSDTEDSTILRYLRTAVRVVEDGTARSLMPCAWTQVMDQFPGQEDRLYSLETPGAGNSPIVLLRSPVTAVTAIRYVDVNATDPTVFSTWLATNYLLDKDSEPARITPMYPLVYPISYPRMTAIEVDFSAGYADRDSVPPSLKTLIHLLCAHYYENREPVGAGVTFQMLPEGLQALIWNERVHHSDDLSVLR